MPSKTIAAPSKTLSWTDASGKKQTFKIIKETDDKFIGCFEQGRFRGFGVLRKVAPDCVEWTSQGLMISLVK